MNRLETKLLEEFAQLKNINFNELVALRQSGMPVDKIIGLRGFYKHDFIINEDVLSPRPDTECLVEAAIEFAKQSKAKNILDLGLGSGCILLSILKDVPQLYGTGVDISKKALEVAQQNITALDLSDRTNLICGSWFDLNLSEKFDIITSNPPYIKTSEIETLEVEVKNHDPLLALDGGENGLRDYIQIAKIAANLLSENGRIFLEVGYNQAQDVIEIFKDYKHIQTIKDLGGMQRCVVFGR